MSKEINIEDLLKKANFAHSEEIPIHLPKPLSSGSYYYLMGEREIKIITFKDARNPLTAKLFNLPAIDIYCGAVNIDQDIPALVGNNLVTYLEDYISKRKR